jgi:hypothetical protein
MAVRTVKIGERKFRLPFLDLVPFAEDQVADLDASIEEVGAVIVPIVCWKEKHTDEEDTVVDGAHRVLKAAAMKLAKVPISQRSFASEEEASKECKRLNYDRRQATTEQKQEWRADRVKEVVELRTEGQSIRTIAETVGVSVGQVQRDLETASTVSGDTVETPNGKITGKDGKQRAASTKPPILCDRCKRVGSVKDCEGCKEARKAARKPKTLREQVAADLAKPPEEKEPETIEDIIKAKNSIIESFCRQVMKAVEDNFPKDEWIDDMGRGGTAIQKFKDGCSTLRTAKCYAACPSCKGDGCTHCHKTGRVPKQKHDTMV